MHRAVRALSKAAGQTGRLVQQRGAAAQLRAVAPSAAAALTWPPVQPSVAASTTSGDKMGTSPQVQSAQGLLDMLGEDEDETRFKETERVKFRDKWRRDGAKDDGDRRRTFRGAGGAGGGGRGGMEGRGGGASEGEEEGDDSEFSESSDEEVEQGGEPTKEDYLFLSKRALRRLPPHVAAQFERETAGAVQVVDPYSAKDGSPVAQDKALTNARGLPDLQRLTLNPDSDFYRGEDEEEVDERDGMDGGEEEEDALQPGDVVGTPEGKKYAKVEDLSEQVRSRTMRTLDSAEAKALLTLQKDDAAFSGPTLYALANPANGSLLPLDREDARRLAALQVLPSRTGEMPPAVWSDPKARAALILRATLRRRALRATYDDAGLKRIAAGLTLQTAGDMSYKPSLFAARRQDAYAEGTDPLLDADGTGLPFNAKHVTFVSNMTWNSAPNVTVDRRAVLAGTVSKLGLSPASLTWFRLIAGPRYTPSRDLIKLSSDAHGTAAQNKRAVLEALVDLVKESNKLAKAHGPAPRVRHMPQYAHA